MSAAAPSGFQNSLPSAMPLSLGANQQLFPPNSHAGRLPQGTPATVSFPIQGASQAPPRATSFSGLPPVSNTSSLSTDWFGLNSGGTVGGIPQGSVQGILSSTKNDGMGPNAAVTTTGLAPPIPSATLPSLSTNVLNSKESKGLVVSGNGFSSAFGVGTNNSSPAFSSGSILNSSGITSASAVSQNSKVGALDSLQSTFTRPLGGNQPPGSQSQKYSLAPVQSASIPSGAKLPSNSTIQQQVSWPRLNQSDIQKYTKVFVEVDKDRDGKITGEQARNLFLSWRLPREILKQVWDLSDQDNDSMLSLREFCVALYLMERYREGRPLPALLPDVLRFDETSPESTGRSIASYGDPNSHLSTGLSHQGFPGPRPSVPFSGIRPPMQPTVPYPVEGSSQERQMAPSQGNPVNPQNREQAFELATNGQKKVKEVENNILDSKEKMEYYRTKMQELVLYKSRCDNRLNEITERASGDKNEVESLAKKYEEKYKQVAEVASKLTVEEATFRDIQGRKLDLQNAIINMERGGSSDGLLQVRADRIQSDLEELLKALHERCKRRGLDIKSKAIIELPLGWQPGIQEGAIDWDEDWDQFDDEGFSVVKDISIEVENDVAPSKFKIPSVRSDQISTDGVSPGASTSHIYSTDKVADGRITESEPVHTLSETESIRSPSGSPGRSVFGAPSQEIYATHFEMNDISPRGKDNHSHGDAESTISRDKFTDEPSWGAAFDANDGIESVWGFSPKEAGHERTSQNSFFGTEDFGLDHVRVDSPSSTRVFGPDKKSPFFDSVPGTPQFKSNSSPRFSEGPEDRTFDDFNRFDSFSMHDSIFSPKRETHARFDSISSTNDFDRTRGFSFDDTDPFGAGPFRPSESRSPRKNSDYWSSY
ncbi:hypothetical protein KSP40_PGU007350 [Platanthera guangdongensis]|uniref:Uncharacterized protein n=1 Tax=Platanthera guangdongensis TaxID=2320717 RepID=A0ABR2LNF4_9ASPA